MIEFLARWILVGALTVGMLLLSGSGAVSACWLAGVWIGFLNAFVRPLVLRIGVSRVFWRLGVLLSLLNGFMFLTLRAWVPEVAQGHGMGHALLVAVVVTVVAWTLSAFFYAHDGHWHWITYHGRIPPKPNRDSPP